VLFQPYKIERSGLWAAVDGRVQIYIHKERMLDDVAREADFIVEATGDMTDLPESVGR
jgi:hypothetical protein